MPDTQDPNQTAPQTDSVNADAAEATEQTAPKIPNKVDVEDAGTLRKKITVTITREKIDAKFDEMFGQLGKTAVVPGFRIGHAPRRLIEKRFAKDVSSDVRNSLLGESLGEAIEQAKLKTLGDPDINLENVVVPEEGDMTYAFEVEIAPEFELPECKGIPVHKHPVEVNDERVNEAIEQMRLYRAHYENTEEAAADSDVVLAGAKISGEGIETVERPGLTLRVAAGQIEGLPLVDLGKELTGKKAGDSATLKVTVPDAHPNEAWRGKELTVEVSISQVRRRVLPEINDEFAKSGGFESLEEMRKFMAERLKARMDAEVRADQRSQICNWLLEKVQFDLPEGVVKRHTARLVQRRYIDLLQRGIPQAQIDENLTRLQAEAGEQAQRDLKLTFILGKIAENEKVEVTEDELNSRIAQMAAQYNRRPERLRQDLTQDGSLESLASSLAEEKTLEKLLEQATITDAPAEEAHEHKHEKKPARKHEHKEEAKDEAKAEHKTEHKAKHAKEENSETKEHAPKHDKAHADKEEADKKPAAKKPAHKTKDQ